MKDLTVQLNVTIRQAMKTLNKTAEKCLLVVDEDQKLLGTLSDGDIRKALLKGFVIGNLINEIYNVNPTKLSDGNYSIKDAKAIFLNNKFDLIPIVNQDGKVVDSLVWERVFGNKTKNTKKLVGIPVIIMAGGKGTRLEPFTKVLPKPLIPIHDKPIIQHIIERFVNKGVEDFYLSINYKGHILKAFFEELQPNYNFQFIEEQRPLGTAGSLHLLKNRIEKPFFVTNCDIIIKADYANLYEFHQKGKYDITLVASAKEYIIPYGTCELNDNGHLSHINEKPKYDFLINTGLYVLNPDVLNLIPKNKFYHITHLIEDAKNQGKKVGVFPIDDDSWIDIGQWAEYRKAIDKF